MSSHMLLMELSCPSCKASLTEGNKIHLDAYIEDNNQDGEVYLSALFGDYTIETELTIPEGAITQFRCPKCDSSILIKNTCKLCDAPLASLNMESGGYVDFCSRKGCQGHAIGGFGDIDQMVSLMNKMFNTPHE